jgi:RNA recognition motif-containing protein
MIQTKELQKTLEGAASGAGATEAVAGSRSTSEAPAVEGEDAEAKEEVDSRSVYVGNVSITPYSDPTRPIRKDQYMTKGTQHAFLVTDLLQVDYAATPEEIQQHFQACGAINRITILCDKFTGHPKG